MRLQLFERPLAYYFTNLFVITENRVYFVPYRREFGWSIMRDILMEIFDLDDPQVYRKVEDRFSEGKIIVGYCFPKSSQVMVVFPDKSSRYVQQRVTEVLGK